MMLPQPFVDPSASFKVLSDFALLAEVERLVGDERQANARLIASLAELDERRLYLQAGCSSLFTFCTQVLHLSEHEAYLRIEAARAARRFPLILARLAEGGVTLTAISLLRPHLTAENHTALLDEARHRTKRDLEALLARLAPKPDAPAIVRRVPIEKPQSADASSDGSRPGGGPGVDGVRGGYCIQAVDTLLGGGESPRAEPTAVARNADRADPPPLERFDSLPAPRCAPPGSRPVVTALSPVRYKVQVTIGAETHDKLRRVQDLLRHVVPDGDLEAVFDRAVTLLLADLERTRLAAAVRPRESTKANAATRHIPATVKRAVWKRDEGRCAFVGTHGRCRETGLLQFHHMVPFAAGGQATVEGLSLRCAMHNRSEAEVFFGPYAGMRDGGGGRRASVRSPSSP